MKSTGPICPGRQLLWVFKNSNWSISALWPPKVPVALRRLFFGHYPSSSYEYIMKTCSSPCFDRRNEVSGVDLPGDIRLRKYQDGKLVRWPWPPRGCRSPPELSGASSGHFLVKKVAPTGDQRTYPWPRRAQRCPQVTWRLEHYLVGST